MSPFLLGNFRIVRTRSAACARAIMKGIESERKVGCHMEPVNFTAASPASLGTTSAIVPAWIPM